MEKRTGKKWIWPWLAAFVVVLGLGTAGVVLAQSPDLGLEYASTIGLGTQDVRTTAGNVIRAFLGLIGILVVALMIYAGFIWMTAGGKEEQVRKAKRLMINGVIGLIIIFSSYAIVSFIFNATTSGNVIGGSGSCPSGNCGGGIGTTGSSFLVDGITPAGPGPGDGGWPRNAVIKVAFNAALNASTIDANTVKVARCNPRNEAFDILSCTQEVSGQLEVNGGMLTFVPDPPAGETENWFESDRWYRILLLASGAGGGIVDVNGRSLTCFPVVEDISTTSPTIRRYCERAMAFSDKVDVEPPTVTIYSPKTPPRYCAGALSPVSVSAKASDDFAVANVRFSLNGDADNVQLVDSNGASMPSPVQVINSGSVNPFSIIDTVFVDMSGLQDKTDHTLSAMAIDLVQLQSSQANAVFHLDPAHCCNNVADADETGNDCGGVDCGACVGSSCTSDADCASGFCNPATNLCELRPVIDNVSPSSGGPGSLITIYGRAFGVAVGGVTFLGGPGEADDVTVQSCSPSAWNGVSDPNTVVVAVPPNAQSGPIRLNTSYGSFDTTDDAIGAVLDFTVSSEIKPGICYLEPSEGVPGSSFKIYGSNFGAASNSSKAYIGGFDLTVSPGGWTDNEVTVTVPPQIAEASYPVKVSVGAEESNQVPFLAVSDATTTGPRVVSIEPASGPPGTYLTIYGTNFGTRQGKVYLRRSGTGDEGLGEDTACGVVWHDTYIVVKVPAKTVVGGEMFVGSYAVEVRTAAPEQVSNDDVTYDLTTGAPGPGICSITPDNGVPGIPVEIKGDNLGSTSGHPALVPRFSVHFTGQNQRPHCLRDPLTSCSTDSDCAGTGECVKSAFYCARNGSISCGEWGESCATGGECVGDGVVQLNYGTWNNTSIIQVPVPGMLTNQDTWPQSGPVRVVSGDTVSVNSIPFAVQNCNDAGADTCEAGTTCCQTGSCQVSCQPVAKSSAYGWLMSTEVLPDAMKVVERATCSAEPGNSWMMSPNPYKDSTDACVESPIYFEFNYRAVESSFSDGNILVRECTGDADNLDCSMPVQKGTGLTEMCDIVNGVTSCYGYQWYPSVNHDSGSTEMRFKKNTWYEVTLRSDPVTSVGFHTPEGRYLDGDLDREPGGDYVFRFKTRDSDQPCAVDKMMVIPDEFTISSREHQYIFSAMPFAENCNIIQCLEGFPHVLSWAESLVDKLDLTIASSPLTPCRKPVKGLDETLVGQPTKLIGQIYDSQNNNTVSNYSTVDVQYKKPKVVKVGPSDGCLNACANSSIYAEFNVPMDQMSLVQNGNFTMYRCRNASCLPPYDYVNSNLGCQPFAESSTNSANMLEYKRVLMNCSQLLSPSTFYVAMIRGGQSGVLSSTGGLLTGLNDGNYFRWLFRVKDLPKATCDINRSIIEPAAVTLNYVGQRAALNVIPVAAPDECDPDGQRLNGWLNDWVWNLGTNPALGGFVNGDESDTPHFSPPVDIDPFPVAGCTNFCALAGSQPKIVQCGNGLKEEPYEACELSDTNCSDNCLLTGTLAPTCGNHALDAGENCEMAQDIQGEWVWPAGCKEPATGSPGCLLLGSTVGGAVCGDSYLGEGEECDDGNVVNGDGCSKNCLREGTLRSCVDTSGVEPCVKACLNGKVEAGEDPICENNVNLCSADTCLRKYSQECEDGVGYNCGSSAFYTVPSFCGDGFDGRGENVSCEKASGDFLIDPAQVVEAEPQVGVFNTTSPDGQTTIVTSTLPEIPSGNVGTSEVTLDCSCRDQGSTIDEQDNYCAQFITSGSELGCANDSCCRPRPEVIYVDPAYDSQNVCRNRSVLVSLSEQMEAGSTISAFEVGYDSGSTDPAACPGGQALSRSWWQRAVDFVLGGLSGLWHAMFGHDASAADNAYCAITGAVDVINDASSKKALVIFHPDHAYPPNIDIRVRLKPSAKSIYGVALGGSGMTLHFKTSPDICTLDFVEMVPNNLLISDDGPQGAQVRARGLYLGAGVPQEISPVAEYSWLWNWGPPLALSEPIVRLRSFADETERDSTTDEVSVIRTVQLPVAKVRARNPDLGDAPSDYVPQDGTSYVTARAEADPLASGTITQSVSGVAQVRVMLCDHPWPSKRICDIGPGETGLVMPWGETVSCDAGSTVWAPFRDISTNMSFYYCRDRDNSGAGPKILPALKEDLTSIEPGRDIIKEYLLTYKGLQSSASWAKDAFGIRIIKNLDHLTIGEWYNKMGFGGDPKSVIISGYDALQDGRTVYVGAAALSPTSDPKVFDGYTNVSAITYSDNAAEESQLIFGQILSNINFNANLSNERTCMRNTTSGSVPVSCKTDKDCWMDDQGAVVGGWREKYRCDEEVGRCAIRCDSDSDCGAYGAVATCNASTKLCEESGAKIYDESVGMSVMCGDDLSCKADRTNTYREGLGSYWCNADWNKVTRDAKRIHDLLGARRSMFDRLSRDGTVPTLQAGTFLPAMSVSAWPSWGSRVQLNADPVNRHGDCTNGVNGFDSKTCWNSADIEYMCPVDSLVYRYRSIGVTDFELLGSLEANRPTTGLSVNWKGNTCIELDHDDCKNDDRCFYDDVQKSCQFVDGEVLIEGLSAVSIGCEDGIHGIHGGSGVCGDGIINESGGSMEACELGQRKTVSCCRDSSGEYDLGSCSGAELNNGYRQGLIAQSCSNSCDGWTSEGACVAGTCGDGVIQQPEKCDDGELNGTYGRCNTYCTGTGSYCGDGKRQANEACDCRELNGQYFENGVVPDFNSVDATHSCGDWYSAGQSSCSWDCQNAGPSCGDGLINADEQCDGGIQQFRGYCDDSAKTGCNSTGDCPVGFCDHGNCTNVNRSCTTDGDCSLSCGHFCPKDEQVNVRYCNPNDKTTSNDDGKGEACFWGQWTCSEPGVCGDGTKQTNEECDDGNSINTDGCVIDKVRGDNYMCKLPRCGDYHVQAALAEECDAGAKNGIACVPEYGLTCTYCTSACKVMTVSGGFCGDKVIQSRNEPPFGPEDCDYTQSTKQNYLCVDSTILSCGSPAYSAKGVFKCQDPNLIFRGTTKSECTEKCQSTCDFGYRVCFNDPASPDTDGDGLRNEKCDPDDDNDGVPDFADCEPLKPEAHGAYSYAGGNGPVNIPAAKEECNGLDDDCNGAIDDVISLSKFKGTVIDPQTGGGLKNSKIQIWCGDDKLAETDLAPNGSYSFEDTEASCNDEIRLKIVNNSGKQLCNDTKIIPKGADACLETLTEDDLNFASTTTKPADGTARLSIKWEIDRDLDLHMVFDPVVAGHPELNYHTDLTMVNPLNSSITSHYVDDGGDRSVLDVDDTGDNQYGFYNPGGIETMTVGLKKGKKYWFYIYDYGSHGDGGTHIDFNDTDLDLKVSWWYDDCSGGTFDVGGRDNLGNNSLSSTASYFSIGGFPRQGDDLSDYPGGSFSYCITPGKGNENAITNALCK